MDARCGQMSREAMIERFSDHAQAPESLMAFCTAFTDALATLCYFDGKASAFPPVNARHPFNQTGMSCRPTYLIIRYYPNPGV